MHVQWKKQFTLYTLMSWCQMFSPFWNNGSSVSSQKNDIAILVKRFMRSPDQILRSFSSEKKPPKLMKKRVGSKLYGVKVNVVENSVDYARQNIVFYVVTSGRCFTNNLFAKIIVVCG